MRAGESAGSAIARSVDLAQHMEQWGYQRYWLAEHHSISGLACSATAVLIGHVAGATKTIRVGSGGVMLPNHAPLVVAEQFGTLEALYPGRIDLGLGRAPGGDSQTMRALRRDLKQTGEDFPELLEELRSYLGPEKPGQAVKAVPGQNSNVPITLLGSSGFSAQLAGDAGTAVCIRGAFCSRIFVRGGAALSRPTSVPVKFYRRALPDGGRAGDRGGDGRGGSNDCSPLRSSVSLRLIRNQPVELLPPVDSMEPLWQDDLSAPRWRAGWAQRLSARVPQ